MSRERGPWTTEQFLERVSIRRDGCWEWLGHHNNHGYGIAYGRNIGHGIVRKSVPAHRLAYLLFVGSFDLTLDVDHLCANAWCVSPWHGEPVTHRENIHRMPGMFGRRARATHCDRGHSFAEHGVVDGDGRRRCRTCRRQAARLRTAA